MPLATLALEIIKLAQAQRRDPLDVLVDEVHAGRVTAMQLLSLEPRINFELALAEASSVGLKQFELQRKNQLTNVRRLA